MCKCMFISGNPGRQATTNNTNYLTFCQFVLKQFGNKHIIPQNYVLNILQTTNDIDKCPLSS